MAAEIPDFSALRVANLFATPLVTHVWDKAAELNAALRDSILAHEANSGGVAKSNSGGWHSETGHLEFLGDPGKRLIDFFYAVTAEATRRVLAGFQRENPELSWTLQAWANVNRSGAFNKMHVHAGSTWSGTYYVDAGEPLDPDSGTSLHLWDPCPGRSATFLHVPDSVFLKPKAGLLVLFPSYLPHMVFPHNGNSARISIAFNLRKEPFP